MLDTVLREAERYSFPIIISDGETVLRNSEAKRTRSLSRVSPLSCLGKMTKEKVLKLDDGTALAVAFKPPKNRMALVYRRFGFLIFMYLPMLENIGSIPNGVFDLNVSGADLPEALSELSVRLFPSREMSVSSFVRISSLAATLSFSEDVVKSELDGDGMIGVGTAFHALGKALCELDIKDVTELSEPPVTLSYSDGGLSISVYGYEIWSECSAVLTAVAPYSFTEKEYSSALLLAFAISIMRSRKTTVKDVFR